MYKHIFTGTFLVILGCLLFTSRTQPPFAAAAVQAAAETNEEASFDFPLTAATAVTPTLAGPTLYLPAIQTPQITPPPPGAVFVDRFDANLGWTLVAPNNTLGTAYAGQFYFSSGTARTVYALAPLASSGMPKRYAVEVTARWTEQASPLTEVGMVFDWFSPTNFHRFLVYPAPLDSDIPLNWWIERWNAVQNRWDVVQSGLDKKNIHFGAASNQIKISRDGDVVTAWINGVEIWHGKSGANNYGQVGLALNPHSTNTPSGALIEAYFDDFIVSNVDAVRP